MNTKPNVGLALTKERKDNKVMKRRFGELAIGSRFCFRGKRYEKVAPEIGRDEDRGGNVFHARTEVLVEALPPCVPTRERKRMPTAPASVEIDDRDLKRIERRRFPNWAERERMLAGLRKPCPPDEYHGPVCMGPIRRNVIGKRKENHGTGN